jgi:cytochrome P450
MTSTLVFNPFTPEYHEDPYPHLAELRRHAPVHQHPMGFWMVTRYSDVSEMLRSNTSVDMRNLSDDNLREQRRQALGEQPQWRGEELSMLHRDPPDHTRLRRLFVKAFTRRAVAGMEARLVELVDAALDRIADARTADLVPLLAFPLPFIVISDLLGMPQEYDARVRELTDLMSRSLEPTADQRVMRAAADANTELCQMISEVVAFKRRHPAEDLLTMLIEAEDNGDVFSDEELVAQVVLVYLAGHENSVNFIAKCVLALLRNPDQLELLRTRPELLENAVEELLRYDAPVQLNRRIAAAPYPLRDHVIPAGSFILLILSSANRDEAVFGPDAGRLRLDRPDARSHLAFGAGVHHCLGAVLARMEGRIAIGRLVRRFPNLRLDGEPSWNGRINLRGLAKLPIAV